MNSNCDMKRFWAGEGAPNKWLFGDSIHQYRACATPRGIPRRCGNRHCPGCQHHKTQAWLQCQLARQLPGHHFMLTFTVPKSSRAFLRSHERIGYSALF